MTNTILVASLFPNPFSHVSQRAAMLAARLNWRHLEYLSVIRPDAAGRPAMLAQGRQSVDSIKALSHSMTDVKTASAAASLLYGLRCSASFDYGGLHEASCRRAGEVSPALIAIAWQSHPWWPVLHNVGLMRDIARHSMKPVLLVRQAPRQCYAHAVYPCDFSSESVATLSRAIRLMPYTRITVLHAYKVPGEGQMRAAGVKNGAIEHYREGVERDARHAYARMLEELKLDASRLSLALMPKRPHSSCDSYVNAVGADLIILSDSGGWRVDEWCRQSRMRGLVAHTSSDILMVHSLRASRGA